MKKLVMNVDSLRVESFSIQPEAPVRRGTVRAHLDNSLGAACIFTRDCGYTWGCTAGAECLQTMNCTLLSNCPEDTADINLCPV